MDKAREFNEKRWHDMTLPEQLGNAGSDFERALNWKKKRQPTLFINAASRTIEQLDMTVSDDRLRGVRRREVARLREETKKELFSKRIDEHSTTGLIKYFLSMASLARQNRIKSFT